MMDDVDDEDDDYVIFDCPGQIELYTHLPIMKQIGNAIYIYCYFKKEVSTFQTKYCQETLQKCFSFCLFTVIKVFTYLGDFMNQF